MILRGIHITTYTYDAPVALDMHIVRLQPRSGGGQMLRTFEIQAMPSPVAQTQVIDAEGNALTYLWFLGTTAQLTIETRFEVETVRVNPFDFIPSPSSLLPPLFSPEEHELFQPYLEKAPLPQIDYLSQKLSASCDGSALGFALTANKWISENIESIIRRHGLPLAPETTLSERKGACRDQALLLMALCRAKKIPSRFVSGYLLNNAAESKPCDLHAWAEIWVPGGGWRGFDPTQGLATTNGHVAVAASFTYTLAAPVTGSFHGNTLPHMPNHAITLRVV